MNPFTDGTYEKGNIILVALQELRNTELKYDEEDPESLDYPKPIDQHKYHKEIATDQNRVMSIIKQDARFSEFKDEHWAAVLNLLCELYGGEFASEPVVWMGRQLHEVNINTK